MFRVPAFTLGVLGWLLSASPATAHDFAIDLEARSGKAKQTAHAETAGPDSKPKARGILEVKAGDRITVRWTLRNADPRITVENVTVHFFAVKEAKVGQQTLPSLARTVAESALTMDFRPRDATEGEVSFTIRQPGAYLVRLQALKSVDRPDVPSSFAALDLVVR